MKVRNAAGAREGPGWGVGCRVLVVRKELVGMDDESRSRLADRIFADLLDVRDSEAIAVAIARRVKHLSVGDALKVVGMVLGLFVLLTEQVRLGSASGADVVQQVRDGVTTALVVGDLVDE